MHTSQEQETVVPRFHNHLLIESPSTTVCLALGLYLQVADRGGLPAVAAAAAASAAGPALPPEHPGFSQGLEDLGEFWCRTRAHMPECLMSYDATCSCHMTLVHCMTLDTIDIPLRLGSICYVLPVDTIDRDRFSWLSGLIQQGSLGCRHSYCI